MPVGLPGKRQAPLYPSLSSGAARGRDSLTDRFAGGREVKSGALRNAPVRRGVRGGSLSSDFELRRRRAPNCGVERVQSKEMGREREGKSPNLPGAAP